MKKSAYTREKHRDITELANDVTKKWIKDNDVLIISHQYIKEEA